jgi:hypothetical protein
MDDRLLRLVGDPSPWADQALAKALVGKQVPLDVARALAFYGKWQMMSLRPRVFGFESGFSQTYMFGPQQYARWMHKADAAILLNDEWERWQFLDITDTPWVTERPAMSNMDWARLLASFAKLGMGRRLRPEYRHGAPPPRVALVR